jgi:uncharacterized membrane protein
MWTLHLLGALWLSAGVLSGAVIFAQLKRTDGDLNGRVFGLRVAWRLMTVFVVPGALVTGALGFYLLYAFRIGFLPGWVKASVMLYFILLGGILFVQVPGVRRALRAAEASRAAGAPTPELRAAEQAKLPAILTHVNATLIFILIFLMAFKPF